MNGSLREEITQRTNILVLGKAGRIIGKHFRAVFLPLGRNSALVGKTSREVVMVAQMVMSKVYKSIGLCRNYCLGQSLSRLPDS